MNQLLDPFTYKIRYAIVDKNKHHTLIFGLSRQFSGSQTILFNRKALEISHLNDTHKQTNKKKKKIGENVATAFNRNCVM